MRSLINFIIRYRLAAIFLLLQVLSFVLLFQNNSFHRSSFLNSSNYLIGNLYEMRSNVTDYFELKEANKQLSKEVQQLRNLEKRSYIKRGGKLIEIDDTLYEQQYQYLGARVINSTVNRQNNYITLNKGSIHGVQPEMGVVSPKGIVGVVKDVSDHFCTVLPVLNSNFSASVRFKESHYFGLLEWDGDDPRYAKVQDVAKHATIEVGDTVVTRGASTIYPQGVMVGIVTTVETSPSRNYHDIKIRLSTDFHQLYYVFLIHNILKEEQKELEKSTQEDVQ